jgi:hypothetical protein
LFVIYFSPHDVQPAASCYEQKPVDHSIHLFNSMFTKQADLDLMV